MSWIYRGQLFEIDDASSHQSFVYLITDLRDGMMYVGKKQFFFSRTLRPLKGMKRRRKVIEESDWLTYYGSSERLCKVVEALSETDREQTFSREILHLCRTKSEATYLEAYEQMVRGVLFSPVYYNDWISCKVTRRHLKASALGCGISQSNCSI